VCSVLVLLKVKVMSAPTAWHKMPTVPRAAAAWELPGLLALHTKAARRLHYYYVDVHAL
jgi:hypothetical protein